MNQQPRAQELSGLDEYQRLLALLDERRFEEALVRGRVLLERTEIGQLARAKTHNLLCWGFVEGLKRATPEAVLHGEEAVSLADFLGERNLQAQALCNLATACYQVADYASARRAYEAVLSLLATKPDLIPYGQVIALQGLAQVHSVQGQLHEALSVLEEALSLCAEPDAAFLQADLHRRRSLVYLKLGQPELAAQALDHTSEAACASGPRTLWWKTHYRFTKARIELARGHWVTARPLVVGTLALARELGDLPVLAECTCLLALLEHFEGRRDAPRRARTALTCAIHSGRRDVVEDVRERLRELLAAGV